MVDAIVYSLQKLEENGSFLCHPSPLFRAKRGDCVAPNHHHSLPRVCRGAKHDYHSEPIVVLNLTVVANEMYVQQKGFRVPGHCAKPLFSEGVSLFMVCIVDTDF